MTKLPPFDHSTYYYILDNAYYILAKLADGSSSHVYLGELAG